MKQEISIKAPAKINLFLDVKGKREDGYHNIESVMQTVSLYDSITVTKKHALENEKTIEIDSNNKSIPLNSKNIVYKATQLILDYCKIHDYNVSIYIEKHIPVCAGLAGGSTDGAATLSALNSLFNLNLNEKTLTSLSAKLGADVPFCITKGTCLATGIGDKLENLTSNCKLYIVLIKDGEGVVTSKAYADIDQKNDSCDINSSDLISALENNDYSKVCTNLYNKFEEVILPCHSRASLAKEKLKEYGADGILMSGSGPSVFGIFSTSEAAKKAHEGLLDEFEYCFLCETVNR